MIADIVAQDADGRDVLLVKVRGRVLEAEIVPEILGQMESEEPAVPFGMVADLSNIYLIKYDCDNPVGVTCRLGTADVLRHYDPQYGSKRVFHDYLAALVEAWLHDLATHWKSEAPPASEQLTSIGLLPRLVGGTTRREVPVGLDPLR